MSIQTRKTDNGRERKKKPKGARLKFKFQLISLGPSDLRRFWAKSHQIKIFRKDTWLCFDRFDEANDDRLRACRSLLCLCVSSLISNLVFRALFFFCPAGSRWLTQAEHRKSAAVVWLTDKRDLTGLEPHNSPNVETDRAKKKWCEKAF